MRDLLVSGLASASDSVLLESPYFAPGRRVLEGMAAAGQRGVRVELILAGKTDHPLLRRAARSNLPRLLHCGVRVFEYHRAMMHAKVAVFDDQWAMVGTSNLDRQSFRHNYEVNLIVEGGELPVQLRERIERDRDLSREIDEASLAARGPIERAIDRIAALLLFAV
jgi:cardiolipin synthase